jgi:hypothetical protein
VMFNPSSFDWHDKNALLGNGLLLLAAIAWAANILYVRAHRWISTPFQLTFWQTLLAGIISSIIALGIEGAPKIEWTPLLIGALAFAGVFGTAFAYWAMAVANRSLPAVTTSLVLLATPVVGVVCSIALFDEAATPSLLVAMIMILGGIASGVPAAKGGAIRPICTPQLPSSRTCALDFFLAGEAYDLIASDRWWFGEEAWAERTKRFGSRHLGRQVVGKCRMPRSAIARTVACRRLRRSISIRCRAALI